MSCKCNSQMIDPTIIMFVIPVGRLLLSLQIAGDNLLILPISVDNGIGRTVLQPSICFPICRSTANEWVPLSSHDPVKFACLLEAQGIGMVLCECPAGL